MRKFVAVVFAFALLVNVSGCGMKGESEAKEGIQNMNDLADAMEKKDQAKMAEIQKKGEALKKKVDDLKLTEEEKKKLDEKYKADTEKAMKRIQDAMSKMMKP